MIVLTKTVRTLLVAYSVFSLATAWELSNSPVTQILFDTGQPVLFAAVGVGSLITASRPWHVKLTAAVGAAAVGGALWRLATAIIEAFRDGSSSDLLRVGIWGMLTTTSWIAWGFCVRAVGVANAARNGEKSEG